MSKRKIFRAAKRLGLEIECLDYSRHATPEESVAAWSIQFRPESADRLDEDSFQQFRDADEAVEWMTERAKRTGGGRED